MRKLFFILFLFSTNDAFSSSGENCFDKICPPSMWKLKNNPKSFSESPIFWSQKNKKEDTNFLIAKMKRVKFSKLSDLKRFAINEFGKKKFVWKENLINKKNIVVGDIHSDNKEYQFYQGYLQTRNGDFYNLNCMSSSKTTVWKSCKGVFEAAMRGLL